MDTPGDSARALQGLHHVAGLDRLDRPPRLIGHEHLGATLHAHELIFRTDVPVHIVMGVDVPEAQLGPVVKVQHVFRGVVPPDVPGDSDSDTWLNFLLNLRERPAQQQRLGPRHHERHGHTLSEQEVRLATTGRATIEQLID